MKRKAKISRKTKETNISVDEKQFNDNEEDQSTDEEDDPGPLHTMDDILNLFKE